MATAVAGRMEVQVKSRSRPPLERPDRRGRGARHTPELVERHRRGSIRGSRQRLLLVALAASVLVPLLLLATVVAGQLATRDWAEVARVNGISIDRGTLRARVTFDAFVDAQLVTRIREGIARGQYGQATAGHLEASVVTTTDPVTRARTGLVDDVAVGQLAATAGVTPSSSDAWSVLAGWIDGGLERELRWVTIDPPLPGQPTPATLGDAATGAQGDLAGTAPVSDLVARLQTAGWQVSGGDTWLPANGPAPGIPDRLVDAARSATAGTSLGPFPDRLGGVAIGRLVTPTSVAPGDAAALQRAASDAHVDGNTVTAWATAEAQRQALEAKLVAGWTSAPVDQVRGAEIVVGPSAVSGPPGPWVELSALRVSPTQAEATRQQLLAVAWPARAAAFAAAGSAASTAVGPGSGEMGYLSQGDVATPLWTAVGAVTVPDGTIVGPLSSGGATYLYLVEARYAGALDDRSGAALAEARTSGDDPAALTSRFDPAASPLAADSGWFAASEYPSGDPTSTALFATLIGARSDPVDLLGDLALFVPAAHRTAPPTPDEVARIRVEAFARWYAAQLASATVVLDPDPLPELQPSVSPTIPLVSPPGLPTPVLPSALTGGNAGPTPVPPGGGLPSIGLP